LNLIKTIIIEEHPEVDIQLYFMPKHTRFENMSTSNLFYELIGLAYQSWYNDFLKKSAPAAEQLEAFCNPWSCI
jgi:hypothetical protein